MIVLELDEVDEEAEDVEEEGELEMFDVSTDRFEQSGFRSRRLCTTTWQDAAAVDGAARSHTANMSSILILFLEQIVDAPVPQITVELKKDIVQQVEATAVPQIMEIRGRCADSSTGGCAESFARSQHQEEIVEVSQLALQRAQCRTIR